VILAIVTFRYEDDFDPERFDRTGRARRDFYVGREGLRQKFYWVDAERKEAGGIYAWDSREAAERVYTPEWKSRAEEAFGAPPEIRFIEITDVIVNSPVDR
jgi:hypothetical protein